MVTMLHRQHKKVNIHGVLNFNIVIIFLAFFEEGALKFFSFIVLIFN